MFLELTLVLNHILNDTVSNLTQVSVSDEFPVLAGFILACENKCHACVYGTRKSAL